jgi:hypothetical protein
MLGQFGVKLFADLSSFTGDLNKASGQLKTFGKDVTSFGKTISTRISAPLTLAAGVSVKAFDTQIQAEKRLEAALRSAGEFSNQALQDFKNFAIGLQGVTTVGDESTLKMLQLAKSMGLSNEQAKRATQNSIALAKAMGINEQSAIRYTAALEQGDSTMLNRYLPTLRQIEDDTERAAKAQELLTQMFSAATSEAEVGLGPLKQLQNSFGDLTEEIGGLIMEHIKPFIASLKSLVTRFQGASEQTKLFVSQIVLIGTIAGPAIVALGVAISSLGVIIGALTSPIALAIGAIAALTASFTYVVVNYEALKERFTDISWWKNTLINMMQFFLTNNPFSLIIKGINQVLEFAGREGIGNPFEGMSEGLEQFKEETKTFENDIVPLGDILTSAANKAKDALIGVSQTARESAKDVSDAYKNEAKAIPQLKPLVVATETEGELIDLNLDALGAEMNEFVASMPTPEALKLPFISASQAISLLSGVADTFTSSFGQGMSNVILQGEKFADTLRNIGKLLASAVIQKAISIFLTGGLGGDGFFGEGGGIFGKLIGGLFKARGGPVFSNQPYIVGERGPELFMPNASGSIVPNNQLMGTGMQTAGTSNINIGGEFRINGTDLVLTLEEANYKLGR